jgi:hypothetical protein
VLLRLSAGDCRAAAKRIRSCPARGLGAAQHALQLGMQVLCASFSCRHPNPHLPRRIVAHVLRVSALEISHPVAFVIGVIPDDLPRD